MSVEDIEGFALMELMIAIAMLGIIVSLIVNSYTSQSGTHTSQNQVVEVQQNARAAIVLLGKEIRRAGHDLEDDDNHGITTAGDGLSGANALSFTYDDASGTPQTATINLFDSTIDNGATNDEIQVTAGGQPIAENIANSETGDPIFEYFDETGTSLGNSVSAANLEDIRAIRVHIIARPDEAERDLTGGVRELTQMVYCRNLGL